MTAESIGELHFTADLSSWTTLAVPGVIKFGLGTYRSQLVLVGGVNYVGKVVGDVWVSKDGTKWQQSESLPPLPTPCHQPAVINIGSPEYLIVAGGHRHNLDLLYSALTMDTVYVLSEGQWVLVQRLPVPCAGIKFTILNGNLYLSGSALPTCYCRVASLIAACESVKSAGTCEILWRTVEKESLTRYPVSFGQQLVSVNTFGGARTNAEIYAYQPFTQSWVHVGNLPTTERPACVFVHTTGELVVICDMTTRSRPLTRKRFKVMKATLKGMLTLDRVTSVWFAKLIFLPIVLFCSRSPGISHNCTCIGVGSGGGGRGATRPPPPPQLYPLFT